MIRLILLSFTCAVLAVAGAAETPSPSPELAAQIRSMVDKELVANQCDLTDEESYKAIEFYFKHLGLSDDQFKEAVVACERTLEGLKQVVNDGKTPEEVYSFVKVLNPDMSLEVWMTTVKMHGSKEGIEKYKSLIPYNLDVVIRVSQKSWSRFFETWLLQQYIVAKYDKANPIRKNLVSFEGKIESWWKPRLSKYGFQKAQYKMILHSLTLKPPLEQDNELLRQYFKDKLTKLGI